MEVKDCLVIVNGSDKTESISSYEYIGVKCNIIYSNGPKVYSYNRDNVRVLPLKKTIAPQDVIFCADGYTYNDIDRILDFGDFYHIARSNGKTKSFKKKDVQISENCLANGNAQELFDYFKATAAAVSLKSENGINILSRQYEMIRGVSNETVLAKYLNREQPEVKQEEQNTLIYPFGLNQSQKNAVENAFASQISIIQGPPGTGKTQTILNIIANAVMKGKTIAVVSNNNSATQNVAEKLEKKNLSFLTAFLGSLQNKENFLEQQSGTYPNMENWHMDRETRQKTDEEIKRLTSELNAMLDSKNRIAEIQRELLDLKPEQFYFQEYYTGKKVIENSSLSRFHSSKILSLWIEYENQQERGERLNIFRRMGLLFRFSRAGLAIFKNLPEETIPFIQNLYYQNRVRELEEERGGLENKLKDYHFDEKMNELSELSMKLFRAELAKKYQWKTPRKQFEKKAFRGASDDFNKEYPAILSTTYSIKGTLSIDHIYDYLIIDEASQVDLATGVLAFSCAKNIVIVGDLKQLPNVLTSEDVRITDSIWNQHRFDERYHFSTHSLLSSAARIWDQAPSVLLREHYRCHPKIAGFFNQKFYNGELIVMTEDHGEKDVLTMYRTADGNHARGHMNQRQIDVIKQEILPMLERRGFKEIGIITPYRDQVAAVIEQLGDKYEIATVHKFQGREKDAIVLASVDNIIGEFVDDPNMLNVAVSRAVKSLTVVISSNRENAKTNYGDLAKYIEYNNCQIVSSQIFSVFDLLYGGYYARRMDFLKRKGRISEYDSENLAYTVIREILKKPKFAKVGCVAHSSLATLVKDYSSLSETEARYASNPLTHLDFLFFDKMNKAPILALEIDGTAFHASGSRQAERDAMKNSVLSKCGIPYLRIRTNESGERERIVAALEQAM